MPRFSQESYSKLIKCHTDLQVVFFEVVKSFDCSILEGYRDEIDQNAAYERGNTKLKWPDSKHNSVPSHAVDVAPHPLPDWKKIGDFIYFGGYVMGVAQRLFEEGKITHKLRYGGDFSMNQRVTDETFQDYLHFEIML